MSSLDAHVLSVWQRLQQLVPHKSHQKIQLGDFHAIFLRKLYKCLVELTCTYYIWWTLPNTPNSIVFHLRTIRTSNHLIDPQLALTHCQNTLMEYALNSNLCHSYGLMLASVPIRFY